MSTGITYGFINFLSGQDYPLKPASTIYKFFENSVDKEYLSYGDIKNDWKEGLIRIENYFLSGYHFPGKPRMGKVINKILPRRKLPYKLHP